MLSLFLLLLVTRLVGSTSRQLLIKLCTSPNYILHKILPAGLKSLTYQPTTCTLSIHPDIENHTHLYPFITNVYHKFIYCSLRVLLDSLIHIHPAPSPLPVPRFFTHPPIIIPAFHLSSITVLRFFTHSPIIVPAFHLSSIILNRPQLSILLGGKEDPALF